jgi:hypothetical protein
MAHSSGTAPGTSSCNTEKSGHKKRRLSSPFLDCLTHHKINTHIMNNTNHTLVKPLYQNDNTKV